MGHGPYPGKVHMVHFTTEPLKYINSPHVWHYMTHLQKGLCGHGDTRPERMTMTPHKVTCKGCLAIIQKCEVFK